MNELSLKLTAFEGPLDLLMHLIEKDKIDIYDIPIVEITEQYIKYLRNLNEFDMEIASEFLVMASTLLQIKSHMLLPKTPLTEDENFDPRQQLVEMLIEYKKIKKAAASLNVLKEEAERFWQRQPLFKDSITYSIKQYCLQDLLKALAFMTKTEKTQPIFIEPQAFSVQKKMEDILHYLQKNPQGFLLNDVFKSKLSGEKVASFLGVLELLKMGLISISQTELFAPIYIFKKSEEALACDLNK